MALVNLVNLEPATRIESILDGEDIAPATRLEYFLKQAANSGGGGSGQSVLVANVEAVSENTVRLDKTWLECKNADCLLIRDSVTGNPRIMFPYALAICPEQSLSDPTQISYIVEVAFSSEQPESELTWRVLRFSTDTETGYPEFTRL